MVDETTTAAKEISIATQQQRSASEQVVSAMGQVAEVSRQYAAGSKQAAAAATELNTLAGDLRASIAQFTTTDTPHTATPDTTEVVRPADTTSRGEPNGFDTAEPSEEWVHA
jgi:hypothetical protein